MLSPSHEQQSCAFDSVYYSILAFEWRAASMFTSNVVHIVWLNRQCFCGGTLLLYSSGNPSLRVEDEIFSTWNKSLRMCGGIDFIFN